ncbi:helix-turn-helix domain-containing protein [Marinobacterium lacunae]|uniref:helix-turn-helix domain-containing protein n=1 Tax=Marinobacterium lacunae TaxID=1232683 RepID=UPI00055D58AD|nr:AraC family transcriptional regulator [Marinobacterium lacunae]
MDDIIDSIEKYLIDNRELPFSVYSSIYEQNILNVPVAKPLLIFVLSGEKELGGATKVICKSGSFIFLSDNHAVHMRNIPGDKPYYALLIEFDYQDFEGIPINVGRKVDYIIGDTSSKVESCLKQFVDSVSWAPNSIVNHRKREILLLLYYLGYTDIAFMKGKPKTSHKIHDIVNNNVCEVSVEEICDQLAMSESTLRRRLKAEGTSITDIKNRARLGLGLHLLQTTEDPISVISERCGYQSQSRFTQRFKDHFGLTPTELRKTRQVNVD